MTQCIAVKPNGDLCKGVATRDSDYCPAHDPARKAARKRSASKAARSKKPHREVADIKQEVAELIQLVRDGQMDRADAAVCGQLYNIMLRGVEQQRRLRETEELEKRLEQLEEYYEREESRG
jgi:hypothetical protein